jgi:hypothetical protein
VTQTPATDAQLRKLFSLFGEAGITERAERVAYFQRVLHGGPPHPLSSPPARHRA